MAGIQDFTFLRQAIEGIVESTNDATGTQSLGNGQEVLFTITTTNDAGAKVLALADISLYVGSVSANNALPGGSAIDESQWQIIGPWSDWGATNDINSKWKVYIRNISAGTVDVLLRTKVRVIANTVSKDASA